MVGHNIASIRCYFISSNRFSEEMLITTLHRPTLSRLLLKPSTCAFTPKSAGGTVPYEWSSLAVSWQVRNLYHSKYLCQGVFFFFLRLCSSEKFKQVSVFVVVAARLLWTSGDEIRTYPGLPGHRLQYLQNTQHGHVHLGAWESPFGQTGQGQCLDSWAQWSVTVATGKIKFELNVFNCTEKKSAYQ